MAHQKKIRVAVLYGGRSGEHEISLRSAASVIENLDRNRFEIVPIGIDKEGKWRLNDLTLLEKKGEALAPIGSSAPSVVLPPNPISSGLSLIPINGRAPTQTIDVFFPVMHGPLCEDGSIQGLLELADAAYVGAGVLGSAVGMDKDVAKRLVYGAGIPIVPYLAYKKDIWTRNPQQTSEKVKSELGLPVFVKPANLGSSVGVHKVKEFGKLENAFRDAFSYDTKVLVERAVNAREIEVSVLENCEPGGEPLTSSPGEIIPKHEFYSYDAKYLDENGAALEIPAKLTLEQVSQVQEIGRKAFVALECEGMARVDLFLDRDDGKFYFNEVNTIPGFTSISMYPKMWEASGISYSELLSRLIELALSRHERKKSLVRDYSSKS